MISLLFILGVAHPTLAQDFNLVQSILDAGTSATGENKTGIELDGCEVTTLVFRPYKDQGWVLHSRFVFDLSYTNVVLLDRKENEYFYFDARTGLAIINFRTLPPYKAAHEMPNYRKPKAPSVPSSRQGADGYVFIENNDFVVILKGLEDAEKPKALADGLRAYKSEFCSPVS
jgi:hypothetical protein